MTFEQYLNEKEAPQFVDGASAGFIAVLEWMIDQGYIKDVKRPTYVDIKDKKFINEFNKQKADLDRIIADLLENNDDIIVGIKNINKEDKMYALHMIENGIKKDLTKEDYEILLKLSDLVVRELKGEITKMNPESGISSEPETSGQKVFPIQATYVNTL